MVSGSLREQQRVRRLFLNIFSRVDILLRLKRNKVRARLWEWEVLITKDIKAT